MSSLLATTHLTRSLQTLDSGLKYHQYLRQYCASTAVYSLLTTIMELRDYQDIAARELFEGAEKLLAHSEPKKLVFKAPTGSGKTVTVAEFLKRLADDAQGHMPLSFIWAAPRQLHDQSKEKLESYYADSHALKCSSFEDLNDRCIEENEILFLTGRVLGRRTTYTFMRTSRTTTSPQFWIGPARQAGRLSSLSTKVTTTLRQRRL